MTIGYAILVNGVLNQILTEQGQPRKLPFGIKLKLVRIKEVLEKDLQMYEQERVRLVEEYGDDVELDNGEKGKEVRDPKKLPKFYEALEDILKSEVSATFPKITQKELQVLEDLELEISDVQIKAFFDYVVEKEEEAITPEIVN